MRYIFTSAPRCSQPPAITRAEARRRGSGHRGARRKPVQHPVLPAHGQRRVVSTSGEITHEAAPGGGESGGRSRGGRRGLHGRGRRTHRPGRGRRRRGDLDHPGRGTLPDLGRRGDGGAGRRTRRAGRDRRIAALVARPGGRQQEVGDDVVADLVPEGLPGRTSKRQWMPA